MSELGSFYPEELARLERLRDEYSDIPGDDAYDGSNAPAARELTARERDIVCAVITDIFGAIRRDGRTDCVPIRADQDWINNLIVVRRVLDPRRDVKEL